MAKLDAFLRGAGAADGCGALPFDVETAVKARMAGALLAGLHLTCQQRPCLTSRAGMLASGLRVVRAVSGRVQQAEALLIICAPCFMRRTAVVPSAASGSSMA